jgi:hypothetical protein
MSDFYRCLRGDNEHLAMFEPDAFVVEDALGHRWICCPIPEVQAESLPLRAHLTEVRDADAKLRAKGLGEGGTGVRIICCESLEELQAQLGQSTIGGNRP